MVTWHGACAVNVLALKNMHMHRIFTYKRPLVVIVVWQFIKYSLLVVTYCWRHNVSRIPACKSQLVPSGATLLRWWKTWFINDKFLKFYSCRHEKRAEPSHTCLWGLFDFHMFEQDNALAHRACEKVEFLDREMPDFTSPCCSMLTRWTFFISKLD